ncbi:MAG: zinc dependent phospholipase C family protein, partial [Bryobacteraceae bacterium]
MKSLRLAPLAALLLCFLHPPLRAYSVLSHEAIIDTVWDPVLKPLLLSHFPQATEAQLLEAHGYAYGGCVIQDMGYYPLGSHFFSDLTHYVRSGDFIEALIDESQDINEYAFALGALSHYAADNEGHPLAVNRSVADMYPKLKAKFGNSVTFAQNPAAHVMVEFSFDVAQIAGAGYLPKTYRNYIGFKIAKRSLHRAFERTYGFPMSKLFLSERLTLGIYRRGASAVIPRMTQIAWNKKRAEIIKVDPAATRKNFAYRLSRSNYERKWTNNRRPSRFYRYKVGAEQVQLDLLSRGLVVLVEILPKIGPLRTLRFKPPAQQTQVLFIDSFRTTLDQYQQMLGSVKTNRLVLENKNLDTGKPTQAGDYALADRTEAKLLHSLARRHFAGVTPEIRDYILAFYRDAPANRPDGKKSQRLAR